MDTWNQITSELMKTWTQTGIQVFQNWLELMGLKPHTDEHNSSSEQCQNVTNFQATNTKEVEQELQNQSTPSEEETAKDLIIAQLNQHLIWLQKQLEQEQNTNQSQKLELQQQTQLITNLEQQIKQLQETATILEQQMGELQGTAAIGARYLDKWRYRTYRN